MNLFRSLFILGLTAAALTAQNFDYGIGNSSISATSLVNSPFSTAFHCASYQQIIPASALQAQGVLPGSRVSSASLIFDQAVGLHWQNVTIMIDHTNAPYYVYGYQSALVVREYPNYYLRHGGPHVDVPGWNVFDATAGGFFWDGVSNIVIDFVVSGNTTEYPVGAWTPLSARRFGRRRRPNLRDRARSSRTSIPPPETRPTRSASAATDGEPTKRSTCGWSS
jgi:hypothetical protein